ncbi:MAG TPA: hypothetical protein VGE52_01455 [Pirellulales bacterium]
MTDSNARGPSDVPADGLKKLAQLKSGPVAPQDLLSVEEFVQLMGGLEHAREVLATLEEIGDFDLADLLEAAVKAEYGDDSEEDCDDFDDEFDDVADAA